MTSKDGDGSANRRWMIGIILSLVFGIFGAVMALLNYLDRDRQTTVYRTRKSQPAAPVVAPGAPAAPAPTKPDPPPVKDDKGKGSDKN